MIFWKGMFFYFWVETKRVKHHIFYNTYIGNIENSVSNLANKKGNRD